MIKMAIFSMTILLLAGLVYAQCGPNPMGMVPNSPQIMNQPVVSSQNNMQYKQQQIMQAQFDFQQSVAKLQHNFRMQQLQNQGNPQAMQGAAQSMNQQMQQLQQNFNQQMQNLQRQ